MSKREIKKLIKDLWAGKVTAKPAFGKEYWWGRGGIPVYLSNGWIVGFYEDVGELDYIDHIMNPEAESLEYEDLERLKIHWELFKAVKHLVDPDEYGPWKPRLHPDGREYTLPELVTDNFFQELPLFTYLRAKGAIDG